MGRVELFGVEGRAQAHAHARKSNDHDLGFMTYEQRMGDESADGGSREVRPGRWPEVMDR